MDTAALLMTAAVMADRASLGTATTWTPTRTTLRRLSKRSNWKRNRATYICSRSSMRRRLDPTKGEDTMNKLTTTNVDVSHRPFHVKIPEAELAELRKRIN